MNNVSVNVMMTDYSTELSAGDLIITEDYVFILGDHKEFFVLYCVDNLYHDCSFMRRWNSRTVNSVEDIEAETGKKVLRVLKKDKYEVIFNEL